MCAYIIFTIGPLIKENFIKCEKLVKGPKVKSSSSDTWDKRAQSGRWVILGRVSCPWSLVCSIKRAQGKQLSLRTQVQLYHFLALMLILLDLYNLGNWLCSTHKVLKGLQRDASRVKAKLIQAHAGRQRAESSNVRPESLRPELPIY